MFVGRGVDKDVIDVSVADGGQDGEVRRQGMLACDIERLHRVLRVFAREAMRDRRDL